MSVDLSVDPRSDRDAVLPPASDVSPLIEDHAAQLIDEIFQELEADLSPDTETPRQSGHRLSLTRKRLLPTPRRRPVIEPESDLLVPYEPMEATLEPAYAGSSSLQLYTHPLQPEESAAQRFLFSIACVSFVGAVGLWLTLLLQRPVPSPAATAPTVALPQPDADTIAFADTVEKSLKQIESTPKAPTAITVPSAAAQSPQAKTVNPAIAPTVPVAAVKVNPVTAPVRASAVPPTNPPLRPQTPPPTVSLANMAELPTLKPSQGSAPKASAVTIAPKPAQPPSAPPLTVAKPRSETAKVTVQGILDFGDKSAMLIERNGSTQQVRLGDSLDGTGWRFKSVENGRAVIQRGGEVNSVGEGEQF